MHDFEQLAWRVRRDDLHATALMQQQLESQMIHMVRRALRRGLRDSPLNQRILEEAERVLPADAVLPAEERDRRIARIARRVCASAIGNLRPQGTVPRPQCETVLA
jgi:hypothetical protein